MNVIKIFKSEDELNLFLEAIFDTTNPKDTIDTQSNSLPKFEVFRTKHNKRDMYFLDYETSELTLSSFKYILQSSLSPNAIRDDKQVYEGTAKEIAKELKLDPKITLAMLKLLRDTRDIQYSSYGEISPKVLYGKGLYYRYTFSSSSSSKDKKKSKKNKLKLKTNH